MKLNFFKSGQCGRMFLALAGAIALWAGAATAAPVFNSPVGTWDFVQSGARDGLAYITFASDFTMDGYEVLTTTRLKGGDYGRGNAGDETRTGFTTPVTGGNGTNLFGFIMIKGSWGYDVRGHVIGFFPEAFDGSCTTNVVVTSTTVTNGSVVTTSYTTNLTVDCTGHTNGVSFLGKVQPNKRFTLASTTAGGKVTFRGVPFVTLPDLSGPWYGNQLQGGDSSTEFFNLSPSDLMPNSYFVDGNSAAFSYSGFALLSAQNRFGLVSSPVNTNTPLRAVIGPMNSKKSSARLRGLNQGEGDITNIITLNIFKAPTATP